VCNEPQNIIDMISCCFSLFYNTLRIVYPAGALLETGFEQTDFVLQQLPIFHFLMVVLTAGQAIFYLQLDLSRSKFLTLFWRSIIDISSFMVIFILNIFVIAGLLHVLGATFDVGNNFDEDYDTNHNDYYLVPYSGVIIAASIRNAVDDLQPPSYNYWIEQYEISPMTSTFYIGVIWVVYFLGVFTSTILALNFLIAIVSQAYENIMDMQEKAIISARS
jgi:hypothetical protein